MDSIFDQIKAIIEKSGLRIANPDYNIHFDPNIQEQAVYDEPSNTVSLRFNPDDARLFAPILKDAVKSGIPLIERESEEIVEDIITEEKNNAELLDFFKDKIPRDDFLALRAALFMRKSFRERSRRDFVYRLKLQIIQKYGLRGKSITNLCTSGYFETLIAPMYNEMVVKKGASPEDFLRAYDVIIKESAFAVFISSQMTMEIVGKSW